MTGSVVTSSPGFISIGVTDVDRSAEFYERYLGGTRDTFDYGPGSAVFVGWPTYALSSQRPPQPDQPPAATIQVWWRASDAQALYERAVSGRSPDPCRAVRWTVWPDVRDGRSGWLPDHDLRARPTPVLATERLTLPNRYESLGEPFRDVRSRRPVGHARLEQVDPPPNWVLEVRGRPTELDWRTHDCRHDGGDVVLGWRQPSHETRNRANAPTTKSAVTIVPTSMTTSQMSYHLWLCRR